jgi:hypothetical protein
VLKKHSTKTPGKKTLCRVSKIKHSSNDFFAECFFIEGFLIGTRQIASLPSVGKKLGKEPNSGSDRQKKARKTIF